MLEARREAEELYERVLTLESLERGPKWEMLLRTSIDEISEAIGRAMSIAGCFQALADIVGHQDELITAETRRQVEGFVDLLHMLREIPTLTAMTEELSEVDIVTLLVEAAKHLRDMLIELEATHENTMEVLKTSLDDLGDSTLFAKIEFLATEHPAMVFNVRELWSAEDIPRTIGLLSALHDWLKEVGATDQDPMDLAEDFVDGLAVYETLDEEDVPWEKVKRELRL